MKAHQLLLCVAALLSVAFTFGLQAQPTAFTYQGWLTDNGVPANGAYDLRFAVFDAQTSGAQQGGTVLVNDQDVSNGLFTVTIDPGANVFTGAARWLDIAVRPGASTGAYTNVIPRQPITSTPYAMYASSAGNMSGAGLALPATTGSGEGVITIGGTPAVQMFGTDNSFVGGSGNFTMSGERNTANGVGALQSNTTGTRNTASGTGALAANTDGAFNTANGVAALVANTSGSYNTAQGWQALLFNQSGSNNTASGAWALVNNISGSSNTALGWRAGFHTTGHNNIAIGHDGVAGESGTIRIGTPGTHTDTYLAGDVHVASLHGGALSAPVAVSGATQAAVPNTSYTAIGAQPTRFRLPDTANVGDIIQIAAAGAGGWSAEDSDLAVWTPRESDRLWFSVASSADGSKLVAAVYGGRLYTSTDSGVTWTARESNRLWEEVASSSDGTKLVAAANAYTYEGAPAGGIYTSANSGVTWTARETDGFYRCVASSSDGTRLVSVDFENEVHTSTDSGVTWTAQGNTNRFYSLASAADGTKLVAAVPYGKLFTSTDSGATWTARETNRYWLCVASSADGTKLVAGVGGGQLYTSTDSGVTWTPRESARFWTSVASSADGTKLVAADEMGQLYTSTDSGVTWTPRGGSGRFWKSVASSADGAKLVAASVGVSGSGGQLYTSGLRISGQQGVAATLQYMGNGKWSKVMDGDLALPATAVSGQGVITIGGTPALHMFGTANVFVGDSGNLTMSGRYNTANGVDALRYNTSGRYNTANGFHALYSNTTGERNTANGVNALHANTTGEQNTANGVNALHANTNGHYNTANGVDALRSNESGNYNTANGLHALYSNTTGLENTADGIGALYWNTNGSFNTAMGANALRSNTGDNNIAIGRRAGYNLTTGDNNIAIGHVGVAGESDTIWIGKQGTHLDTHLAGIVHVEQLVSQGEMTCLALNITSDRNAKEQFTPVNSRAVLEKVAALPLSEWQYKATDNSAATSGRHLGPMAQDFHAAFGVGRDDKHITTVDADGVALAAIQGLNEKLDEQVKAKDAELSRLKSENQSLAERLAALERALGLTVKEGGAR